MAKHRLEGPASGPLRRHRRRERSASAPLPAETAADEVRGGQEPEADTSADTGSERLGQNILWNYLSGFTSIFGLLLLYPMAVITDGSQI